MEQPSVPSRIGRRTVLAVGGGTLLLTVTASGCGFLSPEPQTPGTREPGSGDASAKEAPSLTAKVTAGELPALEDRLPNEPLIVEVAEVGLYGGTWVSVMQGPGDVPSFERITGYQPPLRKNPMLTQTGPGVFADIEANATGTEYTLLLREGLRWSDGERFTAEDVIFAIEDVFGNEELYGAPPEWLRSNGKNATVEKVDDYTVTVTFAGPTGLFLDACDREMGLVRYPKHYAQNFLPRYNKNLDKLVADAGYVTWIELFIGRVGDRAPWSNTALPTLLPWVVTVPVGEGSKVVFDRNPYFWKTDQDGRQLPYIDTLSFEQVVNHDMMVIKGAAGDLDLLFRHANTLTNKPVFAKSSERANTEFVDAVTTSMNSMCIALNLAHRDKAKAELFQNKDFRIGLSHAINREELIASVWQRQGEPWQWAPTEDSIFYDEEFAKQYTDYDFAQANEHLDKAGVTSRDAEGFRKLPDGDSLTITLDVVSSLSDEWPAAAGAIQGMWQQVGIRLNVNTVDRPLFYNRKMSTANQHDAGVWSGDGGYAVEMIDPRWYLPFSDESIWATPWAAWFNSDGNRGAEPVQAAREQIELYWDLRNTPDPDTREGIFRQILAIAKREFWGIGISTAPTPYWLVRNRLKNVIAGAPDTYVYRTPGHINPETWFLDNTEA